NRNPESCWRARRNACTASKRARTRSRIASCVASGTHTAVSSPARCSRARLAASRRSLLTRSPTRCGISDGATTTHCWPVRRQVTLDAAAARAALIAEPQPPPLGAKLAGQPLQRCRRVRDPAVVSNLAPQAAFGYRHDDPVLVNIKPDIRDIFPHDRSPMHEARHRPIRRNPRYLHTVRRVRPVLRRTCGLEPIAAAIYDRMKPSSSEAAQSIALSIDCPPCVQWAIILVIVACTNIWLPIRIGAGAPEIEAITSPRGG